MNITQKSYPFDLCGTVVIKGHGNIKVVGWDQPEIQATSDFSAARIHAADDMIFCVFLDNCELKIPSEATLQVERVDGNCQISDMFGFLVVENVLGDLELTNVGDLNVERVYGDCLVNQVNNLKIEQVVGDLFGEIISGGLEIGRAEGRVHTMGVSGPIHVRARRKVAMALEDIQNVEILTGEGLEVILSAKMDAILRMKSRQKKIQIMLEGQQNDFSVEEHTLQLGTGKLLINLETGGELHLTDQKVSTPTISKRISDYRSRKEAAAREAQNIPEEILCQARARVEKIIQQVSQNEFLVNADGVNSFTSTLPPVPPAPTFPFEKGAGAEAPVELVMEPAGKAKEEERRIVLEMLEKKDISIEQAEIILEILAK